MFDGSTIGIGVLTYHFCDDLIRCLNNILNKTKVPFKICVHDNTDDGQNAEYVNRKYPGVITSYVGENVGCSVARQHIWTALTDAVPDMKYLAILDQDVKVKADWLSDMVETMESDAAVGIVGWPQFTKQKPDFAGYVPEVMGATVLFRTATLKETGGWDPRFFMYRFDTWMSLLARYHNWKTKVVMRYYGSGYRNVRERLKESRGVEHVHMHRGILRYPYWREEQVKSAILYNQLVKEHGLQDINPFGEWPDGWRVRAHGKNRIVVTISNGDRLLVDDRDSHNVVVKWLPRGRRMLVRKRKKLRTRR